MRITSKQANVLACGLMLLGFVYGFMNGMLAEGLWTGAERGFACSVVVPLAAALLYGCVCEAVEFGKAVQRRLSKCTRCSQCAVSPKAR